MGWRVLVGEGESVGKISPAGQPGMPGGRWMESVPDGLVFGWLRSCLDDGPWVGLRRISRFGVGRPHGPHGLATLGGQPRPGGRPGWVPTPSGSSHDLSRLGHLWTLFP